MLPALELLVGVDSIVCSKRNHRFSTFGRKVDGSGIIVGVKRELLAELISQTKVIIEDLRGNVVRVVFVTDPN